MIETAIISSEKIKQKINNFQQKTPSIRKYETRLNIQYEIPIALYRFNLD